MSASSSGAYRSESGPAVNSRTTATTAQRGFRSPFLVQPKRRVEAEDEAYGHSFDRPDVGAFVHPDAQVERQCEEEDVDEWTGELSELPSPHGNRWPLWHCIWPVLGEWLGVLGSVEYNFQDAIRSGGGRMFWRSCAV